MFKSLRWKLTLLYLISTLALVVLVGGGAFFLLRIYFQTNTDLALQYRMAQEFNSLQITLPDELKQAQQNWLLNRDKLFALPLFPPSWTPPIVQNRGHGHNNMMEGPMMQPASPADNPTDLLVTFSMRLDSSGSLIPTTDQTTSPVAPDKSAVERARLNGLDWTVVKLNQGSDVRLLTYQIATTSGGIAFIQVGQAVGDQDRILRQLLVGLTGLGIFSALIVGVLSWRLAGRSLQPAQKAWTQQQTFIANASHELRTPLTLIRASAEVAGRETLTEPQRKELLADILNEVDHTGDLVENMLLLSRMDAGRLVMKKEAVNLPGLLAEAQRRFSSLAGEKKITLRVEADDLKAQADPVYLQQTLAILLENALKYTPEGGQILLRTVPGGKEVEIDVEDSGVGISPQDLSHIFERFYQADPARSGEGHGYGLGLSIAYGLIHNMGGKISAESIVGQGTLMRVKLPLSNV